MSKSLDPTVPFCVRLTARQRAELQAKAGGLPLGTYVKKVLFSDSGFPVPVAPKAVRSDRRELGQVLAKLGATRLASNLNQIAKAASHGSLPVTDELEAELWAACAYIYEMRAGLLRALGIKVPELPRRTTLSQIFNQSSGGGA